MAIIDYHYGFSNAPDAPLWTRMTRTLNFRMDREDAAQLFAALALAPDNLLEVRNLTISSKNFRVS